MSKIVVKLSVLVILLLIFSFLVAYKAIELPNKEKVTIEEKYYPIDGKKLLSGVKSNKEITMKNTTKKCAMEFSNSEIFFIQCDKYLNYKIGEEVFIEVQENDLMKIRRK
ncbi:biopolymer transport protein ExbD [Bacillus pakistanensis]|uniref:Biopolymer transport protein ExbD n=1 Tax=Rossellomorea pakistanensis TaxID=992288 RepID=A0ABS2N7R6_9BACI|nr:hypothetical protein [Bacillus pakistanensis]MBM7583845.1 biopolymer transport protein ExbD [Bacillus pakistanensis]